MHINHTLYIEDLPRDCIEDCSAIGDVLEVVTYWREKLNFSVDRESAVACLKGYGAWDDEQLAASSNDEIANRILWLACCDFSEYNKWCERNPNKSPLDAAYGSDTFVLE
jgi:hypothetical protein